MKSGECNTTQCPLTALHAACREASEKRRIVDSIAAKFAEKTLVYACEDRF